MHIYVLVVRRGRTTAEEDRARYLIKLKLGRDTAASKSSCSKLTCVAIPRVDPTSASRWPVAPSTAARWYHAAAFTSSRIGQA